MFSRCEYCQHQQRVTVKQLRRYRGLLKCKQCGKSFDALASLSDKLDSRVLAQPNENVLPWLKQQKSANPGIWRLAGVTMLLLLIAQGVYFEGNRLLQFPQMHAMANQLCQPLHCTIPRYRNLDEWSISHSDLQPYLQGQYLFSAAISNQADVAQAFPDLKLTLLGFNGQPVAERVFSPRQYVDEAELAGEETRAIQLWLAQPAVAVGGFNVSVM
jgi:predicted Zn finger-like uncharacterized protein